MIVATVMLCNENQIIFTFNNIDTAVCSIILLATHLINFWRRSFI